MVAIRPTAHIIPEFYPYKIKHSVILSENGFFDRALNATAGNPQKFTFSTWLRASDWLQPSKNMSIFGLEEGPNERFYINLNTSGKLASFGRTYVGATLTVVGTYTTDGAWRDPTAWYHFMWVVDSTLSDADDRVKFYINGVRATTSTGTAMPQNINTPLNRAAADYDSTTRFQLGRHISSTYGDFKGYLAETIYLDGATKGPSDFGEFKAGVWIPKEYTGGSFGVNGFHLDYADSSNLGNDVSGNNNDYTANAISSHDQTPESPTNTFCTMNSAEVFKTNFPFDGALEWDTFDENYPMTVATFNVPTRGKWYWEQRVVDGASAFSCGVQEPEMSLGGYHSASNNGYSTTESRTSAYGKGNFRIQDNDSDSTPDSLSNGDVVQIAYDSDNSKIWFGRNGTWQLASGQSGTPDPGTNTLGISVTHPEVVPFWSDASGNLEVHWRVNFGQEPTFKGTKTPAATYRDARGLGKFLYQVPSGFLSLCRDNISRLDPHKTGAFNQRRIGASPKQGEAAFKAFTYSGDGAASRTFTGAGFQPDLVWVKGTDSSSAYDHQWLDVCRGSGKILESSSNSGDQTSTSLTTGGLNALTSDGFSVIEGTGSINAVNRSGYGYVAFCFKAGGSPSLNYDGSLTSSVSVNKDYGFSIATYTGNTTAGATFGHGLGKKPDLIIFKDRAASQSWVVYHKELESNTKALALNSPGIPANLTSFFNSTDPTSSVVTLGTSQRTNSSSMVAYSWCEVPGFSKFGIYDGNSDPNLRGRYNYTGFTPAFLMIKPIDDSDGRWTIVDNARNPVNPRTRYIWAERTEKEVDGGSNYEIDFLSNGFRLRNNNASSVTHTNKNFTYVYVAFADQSFSFNNAV